MPFKVFFARGLIPQRLATQCAKGLPTQLQFPYVLLHHLVAFQPIPAPFIFRFCIYLSYIILLGSKVHVLKKKASPESFAQPSKYNLALVHISIYQIFIKMKMM